MSPFLSEICPRERKTKERSITAAVPAQLKRLKKLC